jgi:uncharacterized protein YrrD
MSLLVRASELVGQPVVTLDGDDVAEVKDVVLGLDQACLVGFTLRGRGFLSGPLKRSLPWHSVHAVGREAVMVEHDDALVEEDSLREAPADGQEVLQIDVMSDTGDRLGHVLDVIVTTGSPANVVGFEIEATGEMARQGQHLLLPADEMVSVSDRALIVPEAAKQFVRDDLTGFGAGVEEYRNQLQGESHAPQ